MAGTERESSCFVDQSGESGDGMNYTKAFYAFVGRHQRTPTYRELLDVWNYKTKSTVDYRVKKILAAGLIGKEGRRLIPNQHQASSNETHN
jgi:hypothetical protein